MQPGVLPAFTSATTSAMARVTTPIVYPMVPGLNAQGMNVAANRAASPSANPVRIASAAAPSSPSASPVRVLSPPAQSQALSPASTGRLPTMARVLSPSPPKEQVARVLSPSPPREPARTIRILSPAPGGALRPIVGNRSETPVQLTAARRLTSPRDNEMKESRTPSSPTIFERPADKTSMPPAVRPTVIALKSIEELRNEITKRREECKTLDTMVTESSNEISQLNVRLSAQQEELDRMRNTAVPSKSDKDERPQPEPALTSPASGGDSKDVDVRRFQDQGSTDPADASAAADINTREHVESEDQDVSSGRDRWKHAVKAVEAAVERAMQHVTTDAPGRCMSKQLQLQVLGNRLKICAVQVDQVALQETLKDVAVRGS